MTLQTLQRTASYAGMAKDAIQLRSRSEHAQRRAHEHLSRRMGKLKGLPQKVGQMLSFTSSRDENDFSSAYSSLQEASEPLPWDVIRGLLEAAWNQEVSQVLASIETEGHAASLGQVHRGCLHDGREVAIKVQYPGIHQAVQTDMKALGWLSIPLGNLRRGFDLSDYHQIVAEDLQQELNYEQEAAHQRELYNSWQGNPSVVIPQVVESLSSKTILVSHWEDGETWDEVRESWSEADRKQMASVLLEFFLTGLFQHGLMQADWHPGNVRFRKSSHGPQLVLYDFGCMARPGLSTRLALSRLIQATMRRNESPLALLLALGFDREYLEPLAAKLPAVCSILFEPFCVSYPYDMCDWKLSERLEAVLGVDRWNFRIAGPASFIFILRSFQGLTHYMNGLGTARSWQTAFGNAICPLQFQIDHLKVPSVATRSDFGGLSTHLKIRVLEQGRTKVQLTQAANNIERLGELLDDDLKQRILDEDIDLSKILADVRSRGYAPGCVFHLTRGEKQVEVSLE